MRLLLCLLVFVATSITARAQEALRPALIGKGPDAIINRIDTKMLLAAGQKNAAVMFCAAVEKNGEVKIPVTYRPTPDAKLLEREVLRVLGDARMAPAIRDNQPASVFFYGTVIFEVIDKKPRLRIFSNQETEELKKESDFIGPQPCFGADSRFSGLHYPADGMAIPVSGAVELQLTIDAAGNLEAMQVANESPPLIGFAQAALSDFTGAKFIPAFRDGKPVASQITLSLYYQARN